MKNYKTISSEYKAELIIKKSKFIAISGQVSSVEEANNFLLKLKNLHPQATHICYAYIMPSIEKCGDDGEPSGTAGLPILNVIKRNNLTNIIVAVVRYFGGVKLGAGGLIRAYSKAAKDSIIDDNIVDYIVKETYQFNVGYDDNNILAMLENQSFIEVVKVNYADKIEVTVSVEPKDILKLQEFLNGIFNRQIELIKM
ncbi:MAG: YigZ family protein [Spirochaetales bacterium]